MSARRQEAGQWAAHLGALVRAGAQLDAGGRWQCAAPAIYTPYTHVAGALVRRLARKLMAPINNASKPAAPAPGAGWPGHDGPRL